MENIINLTKMSLNNLSSVIKNIALVFAIWIIVSMFVPSFLGMLFSMTPYFLLNQVMAYEGAYGIDNLISTLPVKRSDYVMSRYVLGTLLVTVSMVLLLLLYFIISQFNKVDVPLEILIITGVLISLLVISVTIPIVLNFGVNKGKIINLLVFFLIMSVGMGIMQEASSDKGSMNNIINIISSVGVPAITIIISLAIIFISMIISLKLYKVKEIK